MAPFKLALTLHLMVLMPQLISLDSTATRKPCLSHPVEEDQPTLAPRENKRGANQCRDKDEALSMVRLCTSHQHLTQEVAAQLIQENVRAGLINQVTIQVIHLTVTVMRQCLPMLLSQAAIH